MPLFLLIFALVMFYSYAGFVLYGNSSDSSGFTSLDHATFAVFVMLTLSNYPNIVPWQLAAPGAGGGAVVAALGNAMLEALAAFPQQQQQHLLALFDGGTAASEEPAMDLTLGSESTV